MSLPTPLLVGGRSEVVLREAVLDDVPAIVWLLAADELGANRDGVTSPADLGPYLRAFYAVTADPAACSSSPWTPTWSCPPCS